MDSKSRLDYLGSLLELGRPALTQVSDEVGGTKTIFDDLEYEKTNASQVDLAPEKVIQETLQRFVDPENRLQFEEFSRFFFSHFFRNREHVYPVIIQNIGKNEVGTTPEYLQFFENMLVDAASFSYPSIYQMFFSKDRKDMEQLSTRSLFDVRNILALRVYLADLTQQTLASKMGTLAALLDEMKQAPDEDSQKRILAKIPAIFGTMYEAKGGVVKDADKPVPFTPSIPSTAIAAERQFTYDRMQELSLYIPDPERVRALLKIGELFGRQGGDRRETFRIIGSLTREQLAPLFPDIVDSSQLVSDEQKNLVMRAFGMEYETAKRMFIHQTECDNDPSRSFPKVK